MTIFITTINIFNPLDNYNENELFNRNDLCSICVNRNTSKWRITCSTSCPIIFTN